MFLVVSRAGTGGASNALWNLGGNAAASTNYGDPPGGEIKDCALREHPRLIPVVPSQDLTQPHIYAGHRCQINRRCIRHIRRCGTVAHHRCIARGVVSSRV